MLFLDIVEELLACELLGQDEVVGDRRLSCIQPDVELLEQGLDGMIGELEAVGLGHAIADGILQQVELRQIARTFVDAVADVEGLQRIFEDVLIIHLADAVAATEDEFRRGNQEHHPFGCRKREREQLPRQLQMLGSAEQVADVNNQIAIVVAAMVGELQPFTNLTHHIESRVIGRVILCEICIVLHGIEHLPTNAVPQSRTTVFVGIVADNHTPLAQGLEAFSIRQELQDRTVEVLCYFPTAHDRVVVEQDGQDDTLHRIDLELTLDASGFVLDCVQHRFAQLAVLRKGQNPLKRLC